MSWSKAYNLYLDIHQPDSPLLDGMYSAKLTQSIRWTQADVFPLRIYFREKGQLGELSSSQQLGAGENLVLGGRLTTSGVISGDLLVFADAFTEVQDGDDFYYETLFSLKTDELSELFEASASPKTLQIDIEVQDGSQNPLTYKFPVTIDPQAYAGEDDQPYALTGTVLLESPDGQAWILTVTNAGNLETAATAAIPGITASQGLVLKSPLGSQFAVSITNSGNILTTEI